MILFQKAEKAAVKKKLFIFLTVVENLDSNKIDDFYRAFIIDCKSLLISLKIFQTRTKGR